MGDSRLPSSETDQTFVKIFPLCGGSITLPEKFFVSPCDPNASKTVPSLAFLIEHPKPPKSLTFLREDRQGQKSSARPLRLMFDLGLRSSPTRYLPEQQAHLESRKPYDLFPGTAKTLESGGLTPDDIQAIILSHVHYDHAGDPEFYPLSDFVIGNGAWKVLTKGLGAIASHQIFQADLLPEDRTTELPDPGKSPWKPLGPFPAALDLLGDGSIYLIDAKGHLPGHLNLLARIAANKWIYLAGDTAHDLRLFSGEKSIGTWQNDQGKEICIHLNRAEAEETIKNVRKMQIAEGDTVEILIAHDADWVEMNKGRLFPNHL